MEAHGKGFRASDGEVVPAAGERRWHNGEEEGHQLFLGKKDPTVHVGCTKMDRITMG